MLGETPISQEHVRDWSEGLDLPIGGETVLFVDCEAAFYRTSVPRAVAQILQQAGYEFGLMGEQWCCGGPAAEMGYVDQAKRFAQHNLDNWRSTGTKRVLVLDPHDYISFTEDYPKYFGADFDIEVVLVVELFAELIREGRLTPSVPIERAITYHDPCRLNKRKGIWKEPREVLRAIPGLDFTDVDRVTQWSYCSGGGGGLPVEKPELTAAISERRLEKAAELEVDTLVSACPWSERPLTEAGEKADIDVVDIHELLAESLGITVGGSTRRSSRATSMTIAVERLDEVVTALRTVLRDEQILTSKPDRYNRARVPAPFPVHRWAERLPDLAVLPTSTEEVAGVVRIANELRVPVVPRDGGTGLTDGAVPLRGGIVVDVKRMNADQGARPREPHGHRRHRHQHAQAQRGAGQARPDLSRRPRVVPVLAGRRADRHQRLVADRLALRPHPRPGAQLRPRAAHRRGDARRRRDRPQDQQVLQRLPAQAPLHGPPGHARHRHARRRSSCSRSRRPSCRRSGPSTTTTTPTAASARWPAPASRRSPARCCSTSGRSPTCAATTRPTSRSPATCGRWCAR